MLRLNYGSWAKIIKNHIHELIVLNVMYPNNSQKQFTIAMYLIGGKIPT